MNCTQAKADSHQKPTLSEKSPHDLDLDPSSGYFARLLQFANSSLSAQINQLSLEQEIELSSSGAGQVGLGDEMHEKEAESCQRLLTQMHSQSQMHLALSIQLFPNIYPTLHQLHSEKSCPVLSKYRKFKDSWQNHKCSDLYGS